MRKRRSALIERRLGGNSERPARAIASAARRQEGFAEAKSA
jgi:hypothetical protein